MAAAAAAASPVKITLKVIIFRETNTPEEKRKEEPKEMRFIQKVAIQAL